MFPKIFLGNIFGTFDNFLGSRSYKFFLNIIYLFEKISSKEYRKYLYIFNAGIIRQGNKILFLVVFDSHHKGNNGVKFLEVREIGQ